MAPSKIENDTFQSTSILKRQRPKIYLLERFPEAAVEYCQSMFDTILPEDPEIHNWHQHAEAVLVREQLITARDIEDARKLRAIGKQGTGIDIIDQDACKRRDIPILNTPGVNAQSVAELVLTLTMAVARQLRVISVDQASGKEVRKEHCCGTTMNGKSIGIIGMGHIGTAVARMFRGAFGCTIYACDPWAREDAWQDIPHKRFSQFEEMLPFVDMLTIHVPLTPQTRGMIAAEQFTQMKQNAILINVARGGIVDEDDLLVALKQGPLLGAGLDCHEVEPPTLARYKELWETGKVVSTPHIGATTAETQVETAKAAIDNIARYLHIR